MAGHITKVKEGSYRLRYRDQSKYVKAKTDSAAERLLAKFVTEIDEGDYLPPSKLTLNEFVKKWLKDYAEIELEPKTIFRYKQLLDSRILPVFGDEKLHKIKPMELLEFYNSMRKEHKFMKLNDKGTREWAKCPALSENTIRHHHRLISALFEKAIKWEIFKGKNPAHSIDAPKVEKKKAKFYTENQVKDMLQVLDKEELKYRVAVMISLSSGARVGEVMGLTWQDIDEKNKSIIIRQASQYLPKQGTFTKKPKNESSERKVMVNSSLISLLEEYKADQQDKGFLCQDNNPLFVTWEGKPMNTYTLSHWFPKFLKRHGLPHLNVHGLRHSSAAYLIGEGVDLQTVSGRLGHAKVSTTSDIYSHFLESKDKKAAGLIEKSFGKKKEKKKTKKDLA